MTGTLPLLHALSDTRALPTHTVTGTAQLCLDTPYPKQARLPAHLPVAQLSYPSIPHQEPLPGLIRAVLRALGFDNLGFLRPMLPVLHLDREASWPRERGIHDLCKQSGHIE